MMLQAIDGLEADVLTIENSRSGNEMINALAKYGYSRVGTVFYLVVHCLVMVFELHLTSTPFERCWVIHQVPFREKLVVST